MRAPLLRQPPRVRRRRGVVSPRGRIAPRVACSSATRWCAAKGRTCAGDGVRSRGASGHDITLHERRDDRRKEDEEHGRRGGEEEPVAHSCVLDDRQRRRGGPASPSTRSTRRARGGPLSRASGRPGRARARRRAAPRSRGRRTRARGRAVVRTRRPSTAAHTSLQAIDKDTSVSTTAIRTFRRRTGTRVADGAARAIDPAEHANDGRGGDVRGDAPCA